MLTDSDKEFIKATSKEIKQATGELIVRRRLKTNIPPDSYDSDFGETVNSNEDQYDTITFIGKVFFQVSEKVLMMIFGAIKAADALVHIPIEHNIIVSDILFIRGIQYRILEIKEAPLKGFNSCRLQRV